MPACNLLIDLPPVFRSKAHLMFKSCKIQHESLVLRTLRAARRLVIGVIGTTVLLIGVAMVVLPGPAFVVVPVGLGILATEFMWAGNLLKRVKRHIENKTRKNE